MIRRDESGYSTVEVMVAILILMVAILPMFRMFDVGLQTATRSSDYDRARALAEKQTEIAQSVSFNDLSTTFPKCGGAAVPTPGTGTDCTDESGAYDDLRFSVEKTPSKLPDDTSAAEITIEEDTTSNPQMVEIVITVYKEGDDPANFLFKTVGVIADDG